MEKNAKIYVAGHEGLVGSAVCRALRAQGFSNLIVRSFAQLDLRNQQAVNTFFAHERPEYVFLAAAKVGGIKANNERRAEFIYDNIMIEANVIHAAYTADVKKLLFLGSSCIYPRDCAQPIYEEYLLTGPLEPTNEPYAIAKIAGVKMVEAYRAQYGCNFISVMPTNLYGPGDTFDLNSSHVIPALMLKFYEAREKQVPHVTVWGTGKALREFLFVDDCADGLLHVMKSYNEPTPINLASGQEVTIAQLAQLIKEVVGYEGELIFDALYPDGTPRKRLDLSKLTALGWQADISLPDGLKKTYEWFKKMRGSHESHVAFDSSPAHRIELS